MGLGNLWGFAYRASQGGGGAFLLLYVVIVLLVCLPVLVAEMVLGAALQSPFSRQWRQPVAVGSRWVGCSCWRPVESWPSMPC